MSNSKQHKYHLALFKDHSNMEQSQKTTKKHENSKQTRKITNRQRIIQSSNLDLLKQIRFLKERVRCKVLTKLSSNTSCQTPEIGSDDFRNVKQKILREKQRRQKERKPRPIQFKNLYELKDLQYLTFGMIRQNPNIVSLLNLKNQKQRAEKSTPKRSKTENQSL